MNTKTHHLPNPYGYAPVRRTGSIRRTSSIDVTWPEGKGKKMGFQGRCRDIATKKEGAAPTIIAEDTMSAIISADRAIESISSSPSRHNIEQLIGAKGGGYLRTALNEILPKDKANGSPLYLLIDDISGASLISPWAWSRWPEYNSKPSDEEMQSRATLVKKMENICTGFKSEASLLTEKMDMQSQHSSKVLPLPHPDDPEGWHELTLHKGVSMRRARRVDVWLGADNLIHIDSMFQDSASAPEGGRVAVHEYSLKVVANSQTLEIQDIQITPHVLPLSGCPEAIEHTARMLGTPLNTMRLAVLETLPRALGCTHLNDALRALAEAPVLLEHLKNT